MQDGRRKTIRTFENRDSCQTPRLGIGDLQVRSSRKPFVLKYGGMRGMVQV
jgi:hypothetical protein